jgi:hypothetical protein
MLPWKYQPASSVRELTVSEWWKWIRDVLAETLREVSALASLIGVDCRLDRSFRLKTGRRVFGLGVVIAPIAVCWNCAGNAGERSSKPSCSRVQG